MEFCTSHAKIVKSAGDVSKELPNIVTNRYDKELNVNEINENIKEQSIKISIDRNNNKHVLSPLGPPQGPKGIKVSRLSLQLSESSIRHSLVQQFGILNKNVQSRNYNIKSIVLESTAGPSPTRWAIISFITSHDAERALQSASKSQLVELHPGYELYERETVNISTGNFQGLDEFHPQASRTLQISNLPPHLNNFKTIHDYFSKFGKVLDIEIKPKLVPHASALVQFSDITKVVKILSNPRSVLKNLVGSSITSSTSFQFGPSFPTNCIWLGHLSNSIAENHVTEYFSRFGHVLEVYQDVKQQKALVYLDNAFASQQSILHLKRKNSYLGNCRVQVDYASLECQATISYWLLNNFPTLPVPPENSSPKHIQSDSTYNCHNFGPTFNRPVVHQTLFTDKSTANINKTTTIDNYISYSHTNGIFSHKTIDDSTAFNQIQHVDSLSHSYPAISIKTSQSIPSNSGFNLLDMVVTERVQADNAPRVIPVVNKRSNSIRVSNSYDLNCDSSSRISDHISDQSMNNISLNPAVEYLNANTIPMKKDRISLESNVDGRNAGNIRLCNSQTNDLNKSDIGNRQFSPWSAPVRNRVVARVVPYPHTSSTAQNVSHLNASLASKSTQNTTHSIRTSNSVVPQNISRNLHKSYSSFPDKDIQTTKSDSILSLNNNFLHLINDRDVDSLKRRSNYSHPVTYRVKNPDGTPKSFEIRNSSFSGWHSNIQSRHYNYQELSEVVDKPITAAEVFGEDFSDLSDNDSTQSYLSPAAARQSNNRKRKSNVLKCKSPSSDSSSTISVLSTEKQNRFVRISKPHYHSKKSALHLTTFNRNNNQLKLKTCSSSDERRNGIHSSKISHKIKFSIKEKPEKKNTIMKPLTVNVSLTNFEDNVLESDETSSRTTEHSSGNSSKALALQKCSLGLKSKRSPLKVNKRKPIIEKPQKYRNEDRHLSSSSENNDTEYNRRRFQISPEKSKSYSVNEHGNRKMSKYVLERTYKENSYSTKVGETINTHKIKVDNDHRYRRSVGYNNTIHNSVVERQHHHKDNSQLYSDQSRYNQRVRDKSESPVVKRQKIKHENIEKSIANQRSSVKNLSILSSQANSIHNVNKHYDRKNVHQELSSDAAFQKEFDEFKRDQAGDILQGSVQRKGNSSMISSASSTGTKSFTSFKKFRPKKQASSSKYHTMYDTIDSKNIFQIDLNNINIYDTMYDKVKRRAQKQAESKVNQHPSDIGDQRNKRKSKTIIKESKHRQKATKLYHKRQRKSHERTSPSSSIYSGASSPLVDDSPSQYSTSMYSALNKGVTSHRKSVLQNNTFYKSTTTHVVSSFDSLSPHSLQSSTRKESQDRLFLMHKSSQKYKPEIKSQKIKQTENDVEIDNEEHENNSEFSYVTNVSNVINISSKSSHRYPKKESEEIGNGSDATASTEPMEYAEVDLESLKLSDDDWKSGLSSQSGSESGAALSSTEVPQIDTVNETRIIRPMSTTKCFSPDREIISNYNLETDIKLDINMKKEEIITDVPVVTNCSLENELKESEISSLGIETEESAKEEQDIAIASIMVKGENECKSPIKWESKRADAVNSTTKAASSMFIAETNVDINDNIKEDNIVVSITTVADLQVNKSAMECKKAEKEELSSLEASLSHEPMSNVIPTQLKTEDCKKSELLPGPEILDPTPVVCLNTETMNTSLDLSVLSSEKVKESGNKLMSSVESIIEQAITTSDSTSPSDNNVISNTTIVSATKPQSSSKATGNSNPTDKEDLTSYVKSVIERVMQEQSVENQNKLKFDRAMNRRSKRTSGSSIVTNKPIGTAVTTTIGSTSVSVSIPLQKSPAISYQAVVIENNETVSVTSSTVTSGTPSIPGVNVCSPVVTTVTNSCKSIVEPISSDNSAQKHFSSRPNVISIINLSSGTPSLKIDPITTCTTLSSSASELKVNTDLNSLSTVVSDVSSFLTDTNSTNTTSSYLKSPNSDDQTKQRICTRLRRADPNKSDGNYKVVMTISTNRSESTNSNNSAKSICADESTSLKSLIKLTETEPISLLEVKQSNTLKTSDPYEPNFDESPLELSHYRTKTKNTFFPSEFSKQTQLNLNDECVTSASVPSIISTVKPIAIETTITGTSSVSTVIDSVSQVIEDVAHGNFNYNEYLTSFKNGKLTSLQISPSTTPLTFVSNDSRDCSSVSGDNPVNASSDLVTGLHRKSNLTKHNNVNHNIDETKKLDLASMLNYNLPITVTQKRTVVSPEPLANVDILTSQNMAVLNSESNTVAHSTKSTTSHIYPTAISTQYNKDIFALINPTVLCRTIEHNNQKPKSTSISGHESSQQHASLPTSSLSSSIQIQPFNVISNNADVALSNKFQLTMEPTMSQKLAQNNLSNMSINPIQSMVNPNISSVVPNSDESKMAFKQFYFNVLQQRGQINGIDPTAFSQLQNILSEVQLKSLTGSVDNSLFMMPQNLNGIETSTMSSPGQVTNQETVSPVMIGLPQNISSKFIAESIIPREYPLVWEGKLSLKNEEAKVALHFVHGNSDLLNACMQLLIFSGSLQWNNNGPLKIVQRMRLDTSQLEGVQRRMQNSNEYCIGLALPGGDDTAQWIRQSQILNDGFIKYMREKGAAGIINVCHPDNNQQGLYVVHIFPPCEFSTNQLCATAPQLANIIENHKVPSLLVVITTV